MTNEQDPYRLRKPGELVATALVSVDRNANATLRLLGLPGWLLDLVWHSAPFWQSGATYRTPPVGGDETGSHVITFVSRRCVTVRVERYDSRGGLEQGIEAAGPTLEALQQEAANAAGIRDKEEADAKVREVVSLAYAAGLRRGSER